ncbi:serine/threonine protein phosphatase, partial [Streptomyces termitum]
MTEQPTSHEGRRPLADRPQEQARPRQEAAPAGLPSDIPVQPAPPPAAGQGAPAVAVAVSPKAPSTGGVAEQPGRREGDRLRFVGAATRRIARGLDLDEIVLGLCRATVPAFSDEILVYLRDPLPVGDERPVSPFVLRLRRTDRLRLTPDLEG